MRDNMNPNSSLLLQAIIEQNPSELQRLLLSGADPNVRDAEGVSALCLACDDSIHAESRFEMAKTLIEAGADATLLTPEGTGPLFVCVIAQDLKLLEYLLQHGADPNREHDQGERLYDWAEFDYRHDTYGSILPEVPRPSDKINEDSWLIFLNRLAVNYGKTPPDMLFALRKAGARLSEEISETEAP